MSQESTSYELLPPLAADEYQALKADIDANGIKDAIWVDENGIILDGHHRARIRPDCPRRIISGLSEPEKHAFVYRANLNRRNLSKEQKAILLTNIKATALALNAEGKTQVEIGELLAVAQQTVGSWFTSNTEAGKTSKPKDLRVKLQPEHKAEIYQRVEAGEAQEQVAADFGISQQRVSQVAKAERKRVKVRQQQEELAAQSSHDPQVLHGDFRQATVRDDSIDLIFTDPPYGEPEIYADLAAFAQRVLRPGGWCLAYSGQHHLPLCLQGMAKHLTYGWVLCCHLRGGQLRYRNLHITNGWKPILAFYKPPLTIWWDWFTDVISGGKDKRFYDWQQPEAEAAHCIAALCPAGGLVCDPMCGTGTTLVAASRLGYAYLGIEQNEARAILTSARLAGGGPG